MRGVEGCVRTQYRACQTIRPLMMDHGIDEQSKDKINSYYHAKKREHDENVPPVDAH